VRKDAEHLVSGRSGHRNGMLPGPWTRPGSANASC
jgi:hypothetical protein